MPQALVNRAFANCLAGQFSWMWLGSPGCVVSCGLVGGSGPLHLWTSAKVALLSSRGLAWRVLVVLMDGQRGCGRALAGPTSGLQLPPAKGGMHQSQGPVVCQAKGWGAGAVPQATGAVHLPETLWLQVTDTDPE